MEFFSGSASASPASSNHREKFSLQDVEIVHNLIERCLLLYMNKDEVVRTLSSQANIDPVFTAIVWQKLEEENADFFRAYSIRLELKKQILLFNRLVEQQNHLMKCTMPAKVSLAPIQNGIHAMPINNLPMGYPMQQQPPIPATVQPHPHTVSMAPIQNGIHAMPVNDLPMGYPMLHQPPIPATAQLHTDSMSCGISSCHVVNGVPTPSNFHPNPMNFDYDMVMDHGAPDMAYDIDLKAANEYMSKIKYILDLP